MHTKKHCMHIAMQKVFNLNGVLIKRCGLISGGRGGGCRSSQNKELTVIINDCQHSLLRIENHSGI